MTQHHYEVYINHFGTKIDLLDFLMEILLVFKDLVSRSVFPGDWCEMIMLQNSVILRSLRYFSGTIRDYFFTEFEHQAWSNFFHCAIAFLTQPALQLEMFTPAKRNRIIARYNDMRRYAYVIIICINSTDFLQIEVEKNPLIEYLIMKIIFN